MAFIYEREVEKTLVDLIRQAGGRCIKLGWGGLPDRLVLLPRGRVFFAELKREDGVISDLQQEQADRLTALGFSVYFPRSKQEVEALVRRYTHRLSKGR